MNIENLKLLENNLKGPGASPQGLTMNQIMTLESLVCPTGMIFPKNLREFLYLTGLSCSHFHSGVGTQSDLGFFQQNHMNLISSAPYSFSYPNIWSFAYQVELDKFYFIDLNDTKEDPILYLTDFEKIELETGTPGEYILQSKFTLSSFIQTAINHYILHDDFYYY